MLSRGLQVGGALQFNASNVIQDGEALGFWTRVAGGDRLQVDFTTFVDAMRKYPGVSDAHVAVLTSKNPPRKLAIFAFAMATKAGGMQGLVAALQFNNPFSELQGSVSRAPVSAHGGMLAPPAAYHASPLARSAVEAKRTATSNKELKYFYIVSELGACLGVYNDLRQPGTALVIGAFRASPSQQWKWDNLGCLRNRASGLVLDIEQCAEAGKRTVLWVPHGGPSQQWVVGPDGFIRSAVKFELCLDVNNGSKAEGTPVILWHCRAQARKPNQLWRVCSNPEPLVAVNPAATAPSLLPLAHTSSSPSLPVHAPPPTQGQAPPLQPSHHYHAPPSPPQQHHHHHHHSHTPLPPLHSTGSMPSLPVHAPPPKQPQHQPHFQPPPQPHHQQPPPIQQLPPQQQQHMTYPSQYHLAPGQQYPPPPPPQPSYVPAAHGGSGGFVPSQPQQPSAYPTAGNVPSAYPGGGGSVPSAYPGGGGSVPSAYPH